MEITKVLDIFKEHGFDENNCSFFRQEDINDIAKDVIAAISVTRCCTELNHDFKRGEDVWFTEKKIVEISDFCENPDRIEIYEDGKFKIVDKDKLNKVV